MTDDELPWEERNRLYEKCAAVLIVGWFAFLGYFVYLMQHSLINTTWDILTMILLPLMIIPISAGVITFEILYHRRIKKPLRFHLRRAGLSIFFVLISVFSLFGFLLFADAFLSPFLGDRTLIFGSLIWTLLFAAVILKFRYLLKNLQ